MSSLQNNIPTQQASDVNRGLLRARHRNYRAAKVTQGLLVLVSIILPIIGVWVGPQFPEIRPYLALASLILLLMETALFDRIQKDRLKRGAKLQEQFDTDVFGLPWNRFVTGAQVEHEDVRRLSAKPLSKKREAHFHAWYEGCVGRLPLHLARLIGQRTNISYDARLRRRYGGWLLTLTILFGVVLLFVGLYKGLQFPDLIMTLVVPLLPVLTWALRERMQQVNAAISLTNLNGEWEKIWIKALGGADVAALATESRALQDAIYQHRERSPLVFDWVYSIFRSANEDEAHHAAEDLVRKAEKMLVGEAKE
ncbi:S-4TM family putative pore-forming effector [Pseudomonas sp. Irchel 3F5]|uniref:S-4TM family putative pore-forming effector n=1 Tax=Pseudomonas sp. Irchel 3F5 TaxID=2009002 RepID=UPI000BA43DC1|nr:S-4TM family putative pore-forming effector [Pseudomonas sp. Irchel 3F5]